MDHKPLSGLNTLQALFIKRTIDLEEKETVVTTRPVSGETGADVNKRHLKQEIANYKNRCGNRNRMLSYQGQIKFFLIFFTLLLFIVLLLN